ncbi:MAG: hypothetical protein ACI81R_002088 [Bradymonadia bacterium]|jgi:hypothetical protein
MLVCVFGFGACLDGVESAQPIDAGVDSDAGLCVPAFALSDMRREAGLPDDAAPAIATRRVLYELQVRSVNACSPTAGTPEQRDACEAKIAPEIRYASAGPQCDAATLRELESIRLGTFDDLMRDTADPREAVSLRYVAERVGVNAIWLMPPFPNNDRWDLPAPCDNLGSPYAVRDYMHMRGTLSEACILDGRDEWSDAPCWGNDLFERVVEDAGNRGLDLMLDVAFNHVGHNYVLYDTLGAVTVAEQLDLGLSRAGLWDFDATFDAALLSPVVLDTPVRIAELTSSDPAAASDLQALQSACPVLDGQMLVRAFGPWRLAFADERVGWDCDAEFLEFQLPSFYVSRDQRTPSRDALDTTTDYGWRDVKFLFHHEGPLGDREQLRVREYLFRVMNYWVSRGVRGFRLDHATDGVSGLSPETWRYILAKTNHYAALRGQEPPLILAEEFHDPYGMADVADMLTEGYLFGMLSRGGFRDVGQARSVVSRTSQYGYRANVMTSLETHDELRLTQESGLSPETGLAWWSIGAAVWSTPMILAGQEYGERERLSFRRSHFMPGRFSEDWGDAEERLIDGYAEAIRLRTSQAGEALRSPGQRWLISSPPASVSLGQLKWTVAGDVWIVTHALDGGDQVVSWQIPGEVVAGLGLDTCGSVRFVDVLTGGTVASCRSLEEWRTGVRVRTPGWPGWQAARLERCE